MHSVNTSNSIYFIIIFKHFNETFFNNIVKTFSVMWSSKYIKQSFIAYIIIIEELCLLRCYAVWLL
jgi:hypothetical protein